MNRPIDYVICAAGTGERFKINNISIPKPLIKLKGLTLLERSIASLDFHKNDRLLIICQKNDQIKLKLEDTFKSSHPYLEIIWIEINTKTSGQLETFYKARKFLRPSLASVAIFNCDTYFRSRELNFLMQDESIDGIIPCAKAQGNAWSFCKVNSKNDVIGIQEKVRISQWATVGLYFFRDAKKLLKMTNIHLKKNTKNESYVAPLYQDYISQKNVIKFCAVDTFFPMGTPEQIKTFWKISLKDVLIQNTIRTIVVDLDNTITIDKSSKSYLTKKPDIALIKMLNVYRLKGFQIIIHTARNMKTQNNNEGRVIANIGPVTLEWLKKNKVPYDAILFGKPYAENGFYIDDRAVRPHEFLSMEYEEIMSLLKKGK